MLVGPGETSMLHLGEVSEHDTELRHLSLHRLLQEFSLMDIHPEIIPGTCVMKPPCVMPSP